MSALRVVVRDQGPYVVHGLDPDAGLPRRSIVTDQGSAVGWHDEETLSLDGHVEPDGTVHLCRCGHSQHKPFCDSTHLSVEWDGTERAPVERYDKLAETDADNAVELGDARVLCSHAGFCTRREGDVWTLLHADHDDEEHEELLEMIDRCPSGRLTRRTPGELSWEEPDLGSGLVCVVDGQYLLTGRVPVERSDGQPLETRNRMSLCRCGESSTKPLCDGSHSEVGFDDTMLKDGVTAEDE